MARFKPILTLLPGALFLALWLCAWAPALAAPAPPSLILAGSEFDYPPYCVVNSEGQADGFAVELLRAALQAMGHDVAFQLGLWEEVKQDLAQGRVQVLPLVGRTPEREALYDFTFPYLSMHGAIVVREESSAIQSPADLAGRQVAVMRGDNAEEFVRRSQLGAEIVTTATFEQALLELAAGQHDAVIIQRLVALQLMEQLGIKNLRIAGPPLTEFVQSFCFAVREGDKELLALLNEGLSVVIADGTFRDLQVKWFGPIEAAQSHRSRIIVGGDQAYPPFEYLDKNGEPAGYNVELTRAIARELGLEVSFRLGPWGEIREALERGEIDVVQGVFYSPEREAVFDFSPPHTVVNHAIVVREGTPMPGNLSELSGKSILVMQGDILHDAALELGYADQLVVVASQEEALRLLAAGKHDCALVAKLPAHYWIAQHGWRNLRVSESSVRSPEYCYAVVQQNERLLALFSEGLANLRATGEYRTIYSRWLGVYEEPQLSFGDLLKRLLWVVGPLTLLLLGAVAWSYALRKTVRRRTVELRREIAEREEREAEIQRKNRELDGKNAELERFTYTVSHDLKSPLVTIKTFLGFIQKDLDAGDPQRVEQDLNFMHGAADTMSRLLDELLQMARIGLVVSERESIRFRELIEEALATVAGRIAEGGVEVRAEPVELMLWGERPRLVEVWQNLADNAVKYMGTQSAPRIELGLERAGGDAVFFVRDNGLGIEPINHQKIFNLFEQLDMQAEGSGLGLALVKRIVELYGGRIWVESAGIGTGSCFRFTLPAALSPEAGR